ncbi:MAG: HD-GYP domain-containing protein [Oscillospiraceae bacterium]
MIYVPIKHLKPGMSVAQDVTYGTSFFSLIVNGQTLTSDSITKLIKYKIPGIYIQSKLLNDVKVDEFIDSEFKKKTISELKKIYDDFTKQKSITVSTLNAFSDIAESLIMHAISKDECLINIIDVRDYDTYTYTHSMYVGILSALIGIRSGYPHSMLTEITVCGLLHDIGKLDVPIDIINKESALDACEFELIKTHPTKAVARLAPCCHISASVLAGIGSHHERYDGTGYPKGLVGDKIPLYGRILALADVYDALTSERSYRKAWSSSETIEYMMGCAETQFDYKLLKTFLRTVAVYSIGTIVTLSNGFMGVVVDNSPQNCLRPKIRIFEPQRLAGTEINLLEDAQYLSVTITGSIDNKTSLPDYIFS